MDDVNDVQENGGDDLRAQLETAFADAGGDTLGDASRSTEAEPANLSAEDEAARASGERSRDPASGRFTAGQAEQKPADTTEPKQGKQGDATQPSEQRTDAAPVDEKPAGPPRGWSPQSKAAFDALPETVKADIAKRELEINQGFAKLQWYKGLDPYVEMAQKSNTTLPEALERYVAAEDALEKNPVQGLLWLCQNYKVDPRQLVEAAGDGSEQPQQRQDERRELRDPRVDALLPQMQKMVMAPIHESIASFFNDPKNLYAENVADDMTALIKSGQAKDLAEAYEKACWARPDIRSLLIDQQQAERDKQVRDKAADVVSKARSAARSVNGTPINGASTTPDLSDLPLREQLERQFAAAS